MNIKTDNYMYFKSGLYYIVYVSNGCVYICILYNIWDGCTLPPANFPLIYIYMDKSIYNFYVYIKYVCVRDCIETHTYSIEQWGAHTYICIGYYF